MWERPMYWIETPEGGVRPSSMQEIARLNAENPTWRRVADDREGEPDSDEVIVSTVFMYIDHSFRDDPNAAPVLYETMVFGGKDDQYQQRYCTREQALIGHAETCRRVLGREPKGETYGT